MARSSASVDRGAEHAASLLHDFVERMGVPAMILGVVDADGHERVVALRNDSSVDGSTRFQIGSVTKSMVAVALLRAQEAGLCRIDQKVGHHLPWVKSLGAFKTVRLDELLSHTSGLGIGSDEAPELKPMARNAIRQWDSALRGSYYYSNIGYGLLGAVLESIYRQPLAEVLEEQVLRPLGMASSYGEVNFQTMGDGARGHWAGAREGLRLHSDPVEEAPKEPSRSGAGCVVSTCEDMLRYCRLWLTKGRRPNGHRLLKAASYNSLVTSRVEAEGGWHYGYGLMVGPSSSGATKSEGLPSTRLVHSGSMLGFRTFFGVDTDAGVGMVLLSNLANDQFGRALWGLANEAFQLVIDAQSAGRLALWPETGDAPQTTKAAAVGGTYIDPVSKLAWKIRATRRKTTLSIGNQTFGLERFAEDRYAVASTVLRTYQLSIQRDGQGRPLALEHGNVVAVKDGRTNTPQPKPGTEESRCMGVYRSKNPWLPLVAIAHRDGTLFAHVGGEFVAPLQQHAPGIYQVPGTPERFEFSNELAGSYLDLCVSGTWLYR